MLKGWSRCAGVTENRIDQIQDTKPRQSNAERHHRQHATPSCATNYRFKRQRHQHGRILWWSRAGIRHQTDGGRNLLASERRCRVARGNNLQQHVC